MSTFAAVFVDAENLTPQAEAAIEGALTGAEAYEQTPVRRAYGDWKVLGQNRLARCVLLGFDLVQVWHPVKGKDSSDMQLAIDAIEIALRRPEIGTFVLFSGDSDFGPLVRRLREFSRRVIVYGHTPSARAIAEASAEYRWTGAPEAERRGSQRAQSARGDRAGGGRMGPPPRSRAPVEPVLPPPSPRPPAEPFLTEPVAVSVDAPALFRALLAALSDPGRALEGADVLALLGEVERPWVRALASPERRRLFEDALDPSMRYVEASDGSTWWIVRAQPAPRPVRPVVVLLHRLIVAAGGILAHQEIKPALSALGPEVLDGFPRNQPAHWIERNSDGAIAVLRPAGDGGRWFVATTGPEPESGAVEIVPVTTRLAPRVPEGVPAAEAYRNYLERVRWPIVNRDTLLLARDRLRGLVGAADNAAIKGLLDPLPGVEGRNIPTIRHLLLVSGVLAKVGHDAKGLTLYSVAPDAPDGDELADAYDIGLTARLYTLSNGAPVDREAVQGLLVGAVEEERVERILEAAREASQRARQAAAGSDDETQS